MIISVIGKKGSKATAQLVKFTNVTRYTKKCDFVVNYGLTGERFANFVSKFPSLVSKPIINRHIGKNKFDVLQDVNNLGIVTVPASYRSLPIGARKSKFIVKKYHSIAGKGIAMATTRGSLQDKYYQRFIDNRRYELRVHGFLWTTKQDWLVQKRIGSPDAIAWNFHQGGKFQTIHNPNNFRIFKETRDITEKILKMRRMAFGAVDFIVTDEYGLIFLEVNSAPGFTEVSRPAYVKNFNKLTLLSKMEINSII